MKPGQILSMLLERGIQITVIGQDIRLRSSKGALTSELRGLLRRRKKDLLAVLDSGWKYAPLSFAQQRLWFLHQLRPEDSSYNVTEAWWLRGRAEVMAIRQSLTRVIRRQDSLRTSFQAIDGLGLQKIAIQASSHITPMVDLGALPVTARRGEALKACGLLALRPLTLTAPPLFSTILLRLTDSEHLLFFKTHHILADGWSLAVLRQEFVAFYEDETGHRTRPLDDLLIQYADYAIRQRNELRGEVLESHLAYWRRQLANPQALRLPTDRLRTDHPTHQGALCSWRMSEALTSAIRDLCRQVGASLYMGLLATFVTLLHRYTGQRDLLLGTPVASRNRPDVEGLIGFFVNTLVLRADLEGKPTGREVLARVRETALEAFAHQELPFDKLVDEIQPERDLSQNPLFQVTIVLQNTPEQDKDPSGISISFQEIEMGRAHFDLELHFHEDGGGLHGRLVYAADLHDATRMKRLAGHFEHLLESFVQRPDAKVQEMTLLSASELHQLLWEQGQVRPAIEKKGFCWLQVFEEQAMNTPDVVALEEDSRLPRTLSYGALNRHANGVADQMRSWGIGPESRVALRAHRSIETVVQLVAAFKAGGAYIPIPSDMSRERLEFLLADSGAFAWPPAADSDTLARPSPWGRAPSRPPERAFPAGNLAAYVIYTSGSTGIPKGVVVEHQQLMVYVRAIQGILSVHKAGHAAPLTGLATDLAYTMLFPILAHGGRVHLMAQERLSSAESTARQITRQGIDLLKTVPSHLATLLESPRAAELAPGRLAVLGGETLPWELVDRLTSLAPSCLVLNHYGPTETTIGVATHPAADDRFRGSSASVPIGRPLAGVELILADRGLQPMAQGLPAEIVVGGLQLARGYLHRPALTARAFVPNPFSTAAGARLYRTGDLARRLGDGTLEFLGRVDHQVKIRGFRLELGEVEAALRQHVDVRDAVAITWRGEPDNEQKLAAIVVLTTNRHRTAISPRELLIDLDSRLPRHMVPASVTRLDELPLTSSGKLDRAALAGYPARQGQRASVTNMGEDIRPPSPTEEILTGIWREVLATGHVETRSNFFDLGGHSLLGTQVISRVERTFNIELPLRSLFENPTISSLALAIDTTLETCAGLEFPPITRASRKLPLPLSFAQQRLWFLDRLNTDHGGAYHMPAVLRIQGHLDVSALRQCFREIIRRHECLRTTFRHAGERAQQIIAAHLPLPWSHIDLQGLPGSSPQTEATRLAAREARRCFQLEQGPLLRFHLFQQSPTAQLLLLNFHHIISDGWSHGIFYTELAMLYRSLTGPRGQIPAELPSLAIQYADFAAWQQEWLTKQKAAGRIARFLRQLSSLTENARVLTSDRPRPATAKHQGEAVAFAITPQVSQALDDLNRGHKVTLYMTLVTAFLTSLFRLTGQANQIVGSPVAGRNHREIEGLIGFFVNMLVLGGRFTKKQTFEENLKYVRESALEAYAHQNIPFEELARRLANERDLSRHPVFQIAFALQNAPRSEAALAGLQVDRLDPPTPAARFDLELFMWEEENHLEGSLVYSTALFDRTTAEHLSRNLTRLLNHVAFHPDTPTGRIPMLSEAEGHQVVIEWNDRQSLPPPYQRIDELFVAQASRTPNSLIVFEDQKMSYRELDLRSSHLADVLEKLSFDPSGPQPWRLALFVERSFDMLVALLGVLKAGAAFVPLEVDHPPDRLAWLLEDSQVRAVLTQDHLTNRLPLAGKLSGLKLLNLKDLSISNWSRGAASASRKQRPSDLDAAYLIHTSGSTGRPKGVVIRHRGLVNHILWMRRAYPLSPTDRLMHKTPLTFDVAIWEIFWALSCGADLVLGRPNGQRDPAYLADLVADEKITTLHFVPSMLAMFLSEKTVGDELGIHRCSSLKRVICGGEELSAELGEKFHQRFPNTRLVNCYGPSETTVGITSWAGDLGPPPSRVPIGYGVDNVRLYTLDAELEPVALGQAGQLFVGGRQLAQGYSGGPRQTALAFIPDAIGKPGAPRHGQLHSQRHGQRHGQRLYATGDQARFRFDGALEFLGRRDHQIKIRGMRIELREIESVLEQHDSVFEAAVVTDEAESHRLFAYVVVNPGQKEQWSKNQLSHWREVYDALHSQDQATADPQDPFFDVSGWNSSYTGLPIPVAEMRQWLDLTVQRLRTLNPERLLEIGCGNGLILGRLARHCQIYLGTDFSRQALETLKFRLKTLPETPPGIRLLERSADNLAGLEPGTFDTIVINSVIQYFPNIDYLLRVLEGAIQVAAAGGTIFIGDVRSLSLHDAFCASVELHQAPNTLTADELRRRARRRQLQEEELLVAPTFFHALRRHHPRIRQVRILPKTGGFENELSLFRVDVFLHLDETASNNASGDTNQAPNSSRRLAREVRLVELLRQPKWKTAGEIRQRLALEMGQPDLVDPADLTLSPSPPEADSTGPWHIYANDPLRGKAIRQFEPKLRQHLRQYLPDAMIPSGFFLIDVLPRLASGKIDRKTLRQTGLELAQDKSRPHLKQAFVAPRSSSEQRLSRIWCRLLNLDRVGIHDNFFQLGGDSILGIRIVGRAQEAGLPLILRDLFKFQTIAELAREAEKRSLAEKHEEGPKFGANPETELIVGKVPLTPIQHWFFEQDMAEPWHYNQSVLLKTQPLIPGILHRALAFVVSHHDMLRARFERQTGQWTQWISAPGPVPFTFIDLSGLETARWLEPLEDVTGKIQAGLNLAQGPLMRVALFSCRRLFITIHHLVIDRVSWPLLLEDLERAYQLIASGQSLALPHKTTSYQEWATQLEQHANSKIFRRQGAGGSSTASWRNHLPSAWPPLPVDLAGANTRASVRTVTAVLDREQTQRLLKELPATLNTRVNEPLLVALVRAIAPWTGHQRLLLELEGHGREEIFDRFDLSRTVGWFTSTFPVFLDLESAQTDQAALTNVRQRLSSLPHHGLDFGLLRYLGEAAGASELEALAKPEIRFNYVGHIEPASASLFDFAEEPEGPNTSLRQRRGYLLELNGYVAAGELHFDWNYSSHRHRTSTIERLGQNFVAELENLLRRCLDS